MTSLIASAQSQVVPMSWSEDFLISRRNALGGGGASVLATMIAALVGDGKPVRAATTAGPVPEVDSLAVRVVIDSNQFAVAAGKTQPGLEIQHFGWGLRQDS